MKSLFILSMLLLTGMTICRAQSNKPYWQDIKTVAVNKEYPRSAFMTYPDKATAQSMKYEKSPYYLLLNGIWKFYFADSYKQLPENIMPTSFLLTPKMVTQHAMQTLLSTQKNGMISKCRATGKCKDSEQQSIPITVMNSSLAIHNRPFSRKRILSVYIAATLKYRQTGKVATFI